MTISYHGKEKANRCHFSNNGECLSVILFVDLRISYGKQMSFVVINVLIKTNFKIVQPLTQQLLYQLEEKPTLKFHYFGGLISH